MGGSFTPYVVHNLGKNVVGLLHNMQSYKE